MFYLEICLLVCLKTWTRFALVKIISSYENDLLSEPCLFLQYILTTKCSSLEKLYMNSGVFHLSSLFNFY